MNRLLLCALIVFHASLAHAGLSPKKMAVNEEMDKVELNRNSAFTNPELAEIADRGVSVSKEKNWDIGEHTQKPAGFFSRAEHSLDVRDELFYYHYAEPGLMKYTGVFNGISGTYTFRPKGNNLFNNNLFNVYILEGMYAGGKNDYTGGGSAGGTTYPFKTKGINAAMYEARALIGKDFYTSESSRVTPYVGIGLRNKTDKSGGTVTTIGGRSFLGYDRSSTYLYLPFGFTVQVQDKNDYEVSINVEGDYLIQGFMKTHFTDFDAFTLPFVSNDDLLNIQDRGFGLRASLRLVRHYSLVDAYVEPFIRYWNIRQSRVVSASVLGATGDYIEPTNNTTEIGSKFGLNF